MIYGNGIDLAYIPEFQEALDDRASRFIKEYFTELELEYCRAEGPGRAASRLAARYAVKEAFIKALDGPRLHQPPALNIAYREIETRNDNFGRPFIKIHGQLASYTKEIGILNSFVTISHSGQYATAQVMLTC